MKKTVLVCDDDEAIVEVITIILNEKGYDVSTAMHSEEVLETAKKDKPNVILLDLQIPGGGEHTADLLKSDQETASIPLILFSANPHVEEISKKIGADGYISKPFDVAQLEQLLEKFMAS